MAHGAPDAPGAVQKLLAGFLRRCPRGVVILEGVDQLHPRLLPVWINALSEQVHNMFLPALILTGMCSCCLLKQLRSV